MKQLFLVLKSSILWFYLFNYLFIFVIAFSNCFTLSGKGSKNAHYLTVNLVYMTFKVGPMGLRGSSDHLDHVMKKVTSKPLKVHSALLWSATNGYYYNWGKLWAAFGSALCFTLCQPQWGTRFPTCLLSFSFHFQPPLACSHCSSQFVLPVLRWFVSPSWGLHTSWVSVSMLWLLMLTADLTHFPIIMCKDVMWNNPQVL